MAKEWTGKRFGRLVVTGMSERRGSDNKLPYVWCVCDCKAVLETQKCSLTTGATKSCGCLRKEQNKKLHKGNQHGKTHGKSKTRAFASWTAAKQRCRNPEATGYEYYGAIGVCFSAAWDDFQVFYDELGERPEGMSLERLDVSKGYEPGNCIWASSKQQSRNKTNSIPAELISQVQELLRAGHTQKSAAKNLGLRLPKIKYIKKVYLEQSGRAEVP